MNYYCSEPDVHEFRALKGRKTYSPKVVPTGSLKHTLRKEPQKKHMVEQLHEFRAEILY